MNDPDHMLLLMGTWPETHVTLRNDFDDNALASVTLHTISEQLFGLCNPRVSKITGTLHEVICSMNVHRLHNERCLRWSAGGGSANRKIQNHQERSKYENSLWGNSTSSSMNSIVCLIMAHTSVTSKLLEWFIHTASYYRHLQAFPFYRRIFQ